LRAQTARIHAFAPLYIGFFALAIADIMLAGLEKAAAVDYQAALDFLETRDAQRYATAQLCSGAPADGGKHRRGGACDVELWP
jgi:hypothetical protein